MLKAQEIRLALSVPNRLSGNADDAMNLTLKVESMKDFGPEAIVEQVPELKRLLELREALRALKGPLSNVPEFRKKIQELLKSQI